MSTTPSSIRASAVLCLLTLTAPAAPVITEFLTNNNTGLADEEGSRQDWIEIHNPDAATLDLEGYTLTDDSLEPGRWTFPDGASITPGGYLVVFASGKDRAVAGTNLHTNFSLASGGEYLGLYSPAGTVVFEYSPEYPTQSADVSYGVLSTTPGSPAGYFNTPTDGAANIPSPPPAEPVQFSLTSRCFLAASPPTLALSVASPTATIRYTLNRGVPTAASTLYTGPIQLPPATSISPCTTTGSRVVGVPNSSGLTVGMNIRGTGMPIGATISSIDSATQITISANVTTVTTTANLNAGGTELSPCSTTSASRIITVPSTAGLAPGMTVLGTGMPVNALVSTVDSATQITINQNATVTSTTANLIVGARILNPSNPRGGTVITVPSTGALAPGLSLYGTAVPPDAYIVSLDSPTQITINAGATSISASASLLVHGSVRVRARAFEPGRPDGPVRSEAFFEIDALAAAYTSNLPILVTTSWGSAIPTTDTTIPSFAMLFEPKAPDNLARLTVPPDRAMPCSLERRGSSTIGDAKYSMALELWDESNNDRNFPMLGMPSESDWVLHAPYNFDRTLIHNDLIYLLSNDSGRYAPRTDFVEHFHNTNIGATIIQGPNAAFNQFGDYFGIYSFMEKISRGDNRVDVEQLSQTDNTPPAVLGGYMFKVDRLDAGDSGINPPLPGQSFGGVGSMGWVYPKERSTIPAQVVTSQQSLYLRGYLGNMVAALNAANFWDPVNGYAKWIDVVPTIDNHILNVAAKNVDAQRLSAFWYKQRSGKLTAGPLWDFDRAEGSTDGRDLRPDSWRGDVSDFGTDFFHYPWYNQMFRDPNFWQQWIDRLDTLRRGPLSTAHVHARIDEFVARLNLGDGGVVTVYDSPAKRNGRRWLGYRTASATTPGTTTPASYPGEIAWLKNWWTSRLNFMDNRFMRPPVADVPAGPVTAGTVVSLTSPSLGPPTVKIFYTLDGTDPRPPATGPYPNFSVTVHTLISETNPCRAIVPTSAATGGAAGTEWRGADLNANGDNHDDFDHSTWFTGTNGVGYDDAISPVNFLPFVSIRWNTMDPGNLLIGRTAVAPQDATNTMRQCAVTPPNVSLNGNQTCYIRLPFTVTPQQLADAAAPNKLVLKVRYGGGFVSFLNGVELTAGRSNAPATGALTFTSAATATRTDDVSIVYLEFDVSAQRAALHAGNNVLAIHGLNTPVSSADFLVQASLIVQGEYLAPRSPSAVQYTAPITVNTPTLIFARTLIAAAGSDPPTQNNGIASGTVPNGESWSAPLKAAYFPGASAGTVANVTITEVNYHPPTPTAAEAAAGFTNSNDFEFIRITNTGATPVDLTGCFFSNGLEFTFEPGLVNLVQPGQSVVVVENLAAFQSRYGSTFSVAGEFTGELDDGGEHIVLNDKTGAVIADFIYGDDAPWPTTADGEHSLIYVGGPQGTAASWRASIDPGGSGANTFARWQSRYFTAAQMPSEGPLADNDYDGLNNVGEYGWGTDPRVAGPREHSIARITGNPRAFVTTRRKDATDLTWTFESATGLSPWSPMGIVPVITNNGDGTETVSWTIPVATQRYQFRLRATRP